MRHPRTWYAIVDGGHARFVEKDGANGAYSTQREFDSAEIHSTTRDLGAERPGRAHESGNAAHHAGEPRVDLHQAEKQRFVAQVAASLNAAGAEGDFERLVLVAPAHALADLRAGLDAPTRARVASELQKDLTGTPNADLAGHFADLRLL